jgi:hypothetical protein
VIKIVKVSLIVCSLILTSCGSANIKEIKAKPFKQEVIETSLDYRESYRLVTRGLTNCKVLGTQYDMNLYTDIGEGEITASADFGTFLHVDIKRKEETSSTVSIYVANGPWSAYIAKIQLWLKGEPATC